MTSGVAELKQYRYKSYSQYIATQKKGYKKKRKRIWAREANIEFLSELLSGAKKGICHGVRTGAEVEWFRKYLGADVEVIGTDIGGAKEGLVVHWDFNKPNPEWIGRFDFVYSNSFDHAYDALGTMRVWANQLRRGGTLVIEHSKKHEEATKLDPFGATPNEVCELMEQGGLSDVFIIEMPCWHGDKYTMAVMGRA